APSVVNASESGPPREGTLSPGGDFADDPKTGKRRLPDQGPLPTSHFLPGARQHPDGVSKVGVLGLYQRLLAGPDSLKQAPCREPRSLSRFQQKATSAGLESRRAASARIPFTS